MFFDYDWRCGRCLKPVKPYESHDMDECKLHPDVTPYQPPPPLFSNNPIVEGLVSFFVGIGFCFAVVAAMVRFFS
jgi:hypothetical protein